MMDRAALRDLLYEHDSDDIDMPFWDACARGEFLVYRCGICERSYWPAAMCVQHGNRDMAWVAASGRGIVHDYVIMRHAYRPEHADRVPYNVSVIQLEEGPFFHSNVVDCPVDELRSGLAVDVVFEPHESGLTVPRFRRRDSQA